MSNEKLISVEVAYALPERQQIIELQVPVGTTAFDAVKQSGIVEKFPEIDIDNVKMGIFGKTLGTKGLKLPKEQVLNSMDRVEVYRALIIDPKEIRRRRAEKAASASKTKGA
ncbi:MAG: putative ubiquitin-RnfH superfamily antitoxin RatB of RatAB toxin-antitoxin module [Saprospiraceae bacterium]|mgnify:FL=1|jgi:putative ubiquitin-RnfH superfamily antitoxin RatB of RatAB toxin-antitoxin module|tara:strand:+ start:1732 stop:2067 length:336 start_codon:yes stop_codon:yes gene_type:complete